MEQSGPTFNYGIVKFCLYNHTPDRQQMILLVGANNSEIRCL